MKKRIGSIKRESKKKIEIAYIHYGNELYRRVRRLIGRLSSISGQRQLRRSKARISINEFIVERVTDAPQSVNLVTPGYLSMAELARLHALSD